MIEYIIGGAVLLAVIFVASSSSAEEDTSVEDDTTSKTPGALPGSGAKKPATPPKPPAKKPAEYESGMDGKQDESKTPAVGPGGYGPFFPQEAGAGSKKDVIGDTYDPGAFVKGVDTHRLAVVRGRASKRN